MSTRKKIKINSENSEIRYANWLKMVIDLIAPTSLYLFAGRGTGKTSDILAERSQDIIFDMPRAPFAFVGDTYVNLQTNIIKLFLEGWQRKKWVEDIHYVVDKAPPDHFIKPFNRMLSYKHTISVFNGCTFNLVSMDRPSTGAGNSYVHLFGDEAKYLNKDKLNKLTPAIRGDYIRFGHSPFYLGHSFTSDVANPIQGEYDWMYDMKKEMDKKKILKILDCGLTLNDIRKEYYVAYNEKDEKKLVKIKTKLERWEERYKLIRENSIFFYIASSYVNADILTDEYFNKLYQTLELEEYKISVLSMRATLEPGAMFYGNLSEKHFFDDGYNYDYYDKFGLLDSIEETSAGLKYIRHNEVLEAGVDFGNMMSMLIGQRQGNIERGLKFIYTLSPEWIKQLGSKFVKYFKYHQCKVLHMRYDRSGNNYNEANEDLASKLKQAIEYDEYGNFTGWQVNLMSRGQRNVTHQEEYDLCNELMSGANIALPQLLIDKHNCKEVKSSMELAPLKRNDKNKIEKEKKSEKTLPLSRLPMESTNASDAFKYYICKPEYLLILKNKYHTHNYTAKIRN